jgi:hypothetical protein
VNDVFEIIDTPLDRFQGSGSLRCVQKMRFSFRPAAVGFYHFWPKYAVNQGGMLWALAEHYLYTRDKSWLREVAPRIVAGRDFIIRERNGQWTDSPWISWCGVF